MCHAGGDITNVVICLCGEAQTGIWELSVLSAQFYCESKTAVKIKSIKKEIKV